MSDKKINLEEIILEAYGCKDIHELQRDCDVSIQMIKEISIEACRQALELAAENADWNDLGDGDLHGSNIVVDKQSIINTINQIE